MKAATKTNRVKDKASKTARNASETGLAETIVIEKPDVRTFRMKIVEVTPLIQHRFSEKAKKAIKDKQEHKATPARGKRDPHAEYLAACYVMPGGKAGERGCVHAIPARQLKASMVDACRFGAGMTMVMARGAFHVVAEEVGLILLKFKNVAMREDAVKINKGGSLDLRYRPEYTGWSFMVTIRYDARVVSPEQLVNLASSAGFHCGLGELRPNSDSGPGGENGMFEVQTAK